MEGMAGKHCQCRCSDGRRCFTVGCEEIISSPLLVGRLDYYGIFGEHVKPCQHAYVQEI